MKKDQDKTKEQLITELAELRRRVAELGVIKTERKRAEEQLIENTRKYHSLFKNMLNGFAYCEIIVDDNNHPIDFVYLEINDAFERLTGLKREAVVGKKVTEAIPGIKELNPELFDIYGKVALTGEPTKFDIYFEPLEIWLTISVYSPQRGYFVAVFDNITERKQAEERFRRLFEQSNDAVFIHDLEGKLLDVNSKACDMLGYDKDTLLKMPVTALHSEEELPASKKALQTTMETGSIRFESKFKKADGTIIDVDISSSLIDPEGGIVQGITRDITERKQTEDEIHLLLVMTRTISECQDFYEALEVALRDVCKATGWNFGEAWVPSRDGKIMECSPAWYTNTTSLEKFRQLSKEFTFLPNTGLPGRVWSSKQPEWIPDVSLESEEVFLRARIALESGLKAGFGVPITTDGEVLAVLVFFMFEYRKEDDRLVELVSAVATQLGSVIQRRQAEQKAKQAVEKLLSAMQGTIQAIALTVETRDPYTAGHQRRVTALATSIATEMGRSEELIQGISMAGIVHDIGKIYVPAEIMSKPSRLSKIEFAMIKEHCQAGYDILKSVEFPWPIAQIILQHHERMDGSGYPSGLSREDILPEVRILAVADVVEAMASHRPYRPALGLDKALEEITQNKGKLYDPKVADACKKLFAEGRFKFAS